MHFAILSSVQNPLVEHSALILEYKVKKKNKNKTKTFSESRAALLHQIISYSPKVITRQTTDIRMTTPSIKICTK